MRTIVMVIILSIGINLGIQYYFFKDRMVMSQTAKDFQSEKSEDAPLALKQSQWVWEPVRTGISEEKVLQIKASIGSEDLFVATANALYELTINNIAEMILNLTRKNCTLNFLYVYQGKPFTLFAATSQGLYIREGKTGKWELAFTHSFPTTRNCLSVLQDNEYIYLGTAKGLFMKEREHVIWKKIEGEFKGRQIFAILEDDEFVYFHDENSVYRFNKNSKKIKKIFILKEKAFGQTEKPPEEEQINQTIYKMKILHNQSLLIITEKGFFLSADQGQTFHNILGNWSLYNEVTGIVDLSPSYGEKTIQGAHSFSNRQNPERVQDLIVGTRRGAFFLAEGKWTALYAGLTTNVINDLAMDQNGNIYAATDRGLFYLSAEKTSPVLERKDFDEAVFPVTFEGEESFQKEIKRKQDKIRSLFKDEPPIEQVHQWAIAYAEVSNEKIQTWRKQAKKRAWFPKLSMGLDGAKNKTISDSIYGSYSSGGQSFIGPDDKTFYDDFGWDVDLSWDLADLIYTKEQTSIDSRAKLMVELRDDILDQVTRLFFERKRLLLESIFHQGDEGFNAVDYELRIEELTALIDGMTGGKFLRDQNMRKMSEKESE